MATVVMPPSGGMERGDPGVPAVAPTSLKSLIASTLAAFVGSVPATYSARADRPSLSVSLVDCDKKGQQKFRC